MKKLTNYKEGNKGGYGGCLVWFIPIIAFLVISCNRKMNLQTNKVSVDSTIYHKYDSVVEVNKTQSEAYESLLQTANSTGVVFESTPCDTGKIGGSGMPHVINKITVAPDGTKTFEGNIKSFNDNQVKHEEKRETKVNEYKELQERHNQLISSYAKEVSTKDKRVKNTGLPWWLIACGIIFFLLWANERFSVFKIPIITRTTLFNKQKTKL